MICACACVATDVACGSFGGKITDACLYVHNNRIKALFLQEKKLRAMMAQCHMWYLEQKHASEDEISMVRLCIFVAVCYV